jgi:hypothetical protein
MGNIGSRFLLTGEEDFYHDKNHGLILNFMPNYYLGTFVRKHDLTWFVYAVSHTYETYSLITLIRALNIYSADQSHYNEFQSEIGNQWVCAANGV